MTTEQIPSSDSQDMLPKAPEKQVLIQNVFVIQQTVYM